MANCLVWGLAAAGLALAPVPSGTSPLAHGQPEPLVAPALFLAPHDLGELGAAGRVGVRAERGDIGAAGPRAEVPWGELATTWFFIRARGTQENRETVVDFLLGGGPDAAAGTVALPAGSTGLVMVGAEGTSRVDVVTAQAWREFAQRELDAVVSEALMKRLGEAESVRVRRVESSKLVVRVDDDAEVVDEQTASSKSGQAGEIRLLMDPTALPVGADVPVRTYAAYSSRGGVRVRASCDTCPDVQVFSGDRHGIGAVRLSAAGRWRIVAQFAEPLGAGEDADVVLYTATLVFDVPDAKEGKR